MCVRARTFGDAHIRNDDDGIDKERMMMMLLAMQDNLLYCVRTREINQFNRKLGGD